MELTTKIYKNSIIVLVLLSIPSAFIDWKTYPSGIMAGGILGLVNLKALSWGIEGIIGSRRATAPMVFFSMFRLFFLLIIVAALVQLKLANILGIIAGFTVVFMMILIEGFKFAKKSG
ncbi:MAG: hypothetical protein VST72_08260 [Nitrospirota bacterium]|nr:hypothetical protein [Nitrospirota bacterium]